MKPAVNPPPQVLELMHRLEQAGESYWVVGGCVRDSLMGRTPGDWDMTTSALPQRMLELFADHRLVTAGLCHGTVGVVQDGSLYEITTYRLESGCSDHRHPDSVRFTAEIRQDLARRDLTVNAMAWHPQRGLLDCFDGRQDLSRRLIRCVGDSERRFEEDALRILRALRFASTLDFFLEEQTLSATCKQAPLLRRISAERIWTELRKLLEGAAALRVLEQAQPVLSQILPELANTQPQASFSSLLPDAVLRLSCGGQAVSVVGTIPLPVPGDRRRFCAVCAVPMRTVSAPMRWLRSPKNPPIPYSDCGQPCGISASMRCRTGFRSFGQRMKNGQTTFAMRLPWHSRAVGNAPSCKSTASSFLSWAVRVGRSSATC